MLSLLSPRLLAALALVAFLSLTHFTAYRHGKSVVHTEWQIEKTKQAEAIAQAEADARAKEQKLIADKQKVEVEYAKHKRAAAIDSSAANSELNGLRSVLADLGKASSNPGATNGNHGRGGLEYQLFGDCAQALTDLAGEADKLENKLVAFQQWAKAIKEIK